MFSQRYYQNFAELVKELHKEGFSIKERIVIAHKLSKMFNIDNPQFKPYTFIRACGLSPVKEKV